MPLKYLPILFSLLITSGSGSNLIEIDSNALQNKLENYKWKKRILLLITKEEDTVLVNEVNKFFMTHKCKNDERNLELIKLKKRNDNYKKRESYFKDKTGIWLIGYDGNIKGYTKDNTLLLNLHNLNLDKELTINDIKDSFIKYFQYPEIPFPDLLLRTAGETRISNFLLYQISYTELLFIEDLWPDINADILDDVLLEFNSRNRTYGKNG